MTARLARTFRSSRTLPGDGCAARAATVSRASAARLPAPRGDVPPAVGGEPGDVRPPVARRRRGEPEDREAVQQVLAEAAGPRLGVQRPVGGGDRRALASERRAARGHRAQPLALGVVGEAGWCRRARRRVVGARRPRRDGGLVGGRSLETGGWWTHGLPPQSGTETTDTARRRLPIDTQARRATPRRRRPASPGCGVAARLWTESDTAPAVRNGNKPDWKGPRGPKSG